MRRLETLPGAEAQVDLGTGAPIVGPDGRRRRTHVFRIVLSHSRKGYSEVVFRQDTDSVWSQNSAAPEYGLAFTVKPPIKLPAGRVSVWPYRQFAHKNRSDLGNPDGKHTPGARASETS